jgi:hypothetical protein
VDKPRDPWQRNGTYLVADVQYIFTFLTPHEAGRRANMVRCVRKPNNSMRFGYSLATPDFRKAFYQRKASMERENATVLLYSKDLRLPSIMLTVG